MLTFIHERTFHATYCSLSDTVKSPVFVVEKVSADHDKTVYYRGVENYHPHPLVSPQITQVALP